MNRIDDERIKFYLKHEVRIREWASLEAEVREVTDRFDSSLKDDLDAALKSGNIADAGVESFIDDESGDWRGVGLRRQGWPKGNKDPDVRLEWNRTWARFAPGGYLICGVRTKTESYRQLFTKERCPSFPRQKDWWPAYENVDPPTDKEWEGDNLEEYRDHLVETILKAWRDLAPLVDEAVGHPRS